MLYLVICHRGLWGISVVDLDRCLSVALMYDICVWLCKS